VAHTGSLSLGAADRFRFAVPSGGDVSQGLARFGRRSSGLSNGQGFAPSGAAGASVKGNDPLKIGSALSVTALSAALASSSLADILAPLENSMDKSKAPTEPSKAGDEAKKTQRTRGEATTAELGEASTTSQSAMRAMVR
jgi:hypothetical protein